MTEISEGDIKELRERVKSERERLAELEYQPGMETLQWDYATVSDIELDNADPREYGLYRAGVAEGMAVALHILTDE